MQNSTLYIFSGLPASGKSTLAKKLAEKTGFTYLRIDTLEQGLREICGITDIEGKGYALNHLIAKDNLLVGNNVIADMVNGWELTRNDWNNVATSVGSSFVNIQIICSDEKEHRHRVENRDVGIKNLILPTWDEVINREYHEWTMPRILIDTAGKSLEESFNQLLSELKI